MPEQEKQPRKLGCVASLFFVPLLFLGAALLLPYAAVAKAIWSRKRSRIVKIDGRKKSSH
jgi:hypothetical protein